VTFKDSPAAHGRKASAITRYRVVLMLSIVLNVAVAFFIIMRPDGFTSLLHQPEAFPNTWPRHWGFQLLAINGLYLPGFWNPAGQRWPNWSGIVIRITYALFFLSQGDGFVPMGIYDGLSGLALLFTYLPVVRGAARDVTTGSAL
jgi:hypothetical protein